MEVSIGPRPFRHGNAKDLLTIHKLVEMFQLGHVLSDMEIDKDDSVKEKKISRFNWATSFQTWKCR